MGILSEVMNVLDGKEPVTLKSGNFSLTFNPGAKSADAPALSERAPVVGISGSSESSKSVIAAMTQIRSAGGVPVYIGHFADREHREGSIQQAVKHDLSRVDALMVLGNDGDIDPAKYGAAKDSHTKVETDKARAAYEEAAITQALESGKPLLGVCGGMQRMNILGGGTLHQHVPDIVGDNHHTQGDSNIAGFVPVQVVKFTEGSMLRDIGGETKSLYTPTHQELPPGTVMENSFHHQAVKDVRPDFQVNAISSDGIIEGIEPKLGSRYGKQFALGVQWHPEFGASEVGAKIAKNFVGAAKTYAHDHPSAEFKPLNENTQNYDVHTNMPLGRPAPQLMHLDPALIRTDPASYQFRSDIDAKGLTETHRLKAERWDSILNGDPLIVHQRSNGDYFVVDGHHRLDLAQRTNAQGTGPGSVAVQVLRETDGYSIQDAKVIAAYKNLSNELNRDNSSEQALLDGARVLKEGRKTAHPEWLPSLQMDKGDLHVSYALSGMSDYAMEAVTKGKITARSAAIVADGLPDQAMQDQAVRIIAEKLPQKDYDIALKAQGMPMSQDGAFGVTLPQEHAAAPAQPAFVPPLSHVGRLMSQRAAAGAAMAR